MTEERETPVMAASPSQAVSGPKGTDDRTSEENLATTNAQLIVART